MALADLPIPNDASDPCPRALAPKRVARISLKLLSGLPAKPSGEIWIWDTELRGFFVRAYPSGVKTFAVKYRAEGRQKIFTIGKFGSPWTVELARKRAADVLHDADRGRDPQGAKTQARQALTVSDLIEVYLREGPADKPNKRPSSWSNDRLHLRHHVSPLLGRMKAHAMASTDVAKLQADVAAGKTAGETKTKKRGVARVRGGQRAAAVTVVCLQAMYNWAIKRKLATHNPAKGVERFKSEAQERYLSMGELNRLLATLAQMQDQEELDPRFASAFRILLLTGARKSEIGDLRWEEVDLQRGFITLSAMRSKTGRKRIALSAAALAELKSLNPQRTGYVFPAKRGDGPTRSLQDAWEAVRIEAQIEDVRIHDLRHTFASLAAAEGQSLYLIGKALGHSQSRTTERYAHLAAESIRRLGDVVADKIAASRPNRRVDLANVSSDDTNGPA